MAKRVLGLILLLMLVSAGVAQAQENGEFLGIDAGSYTPGSWVTIRWRVTNVSFALLEIYDLGQSTTPEQAYRDLPTEGSQSFYLSPALTHGVLVVLHSANLSTQAFTYVPMYDVLRSQSLVLPVVSPTPVASATPVPDCVPTFDFPGDHSTDCVPMRQGNDQATYQSFENGFMIWRKSSGDVWVMEKSGLALYYPEAVYGLMPDNPVSDTPPAGRSAPANGFGRVWGNVEDVRKALGWALGSEVSYTMTVQYSAEPFFTPYFFMTLPDNGVVRMLGGVWAFEPAQ